MWQAGMQPARYETTSVRIGAGDYRFTVAASKIVFEGFRTVYTEAGEEKEEKNVLLNGLEKGMELTEKVLRPNSISPSRRLTIQKRPWLNIWKSWALDGQVLTRPRFPLSLPGAMWLKKIKTFI